MQRWPFTSAKWSADLISGAQLSSLCSSCCLCAACYSELIPRPVRGGTTGGRPEVSLLSCSGLSVATALLPPPPSISLPPPLLSDLWFVSTRRQRHPQVHFKNERGGGFTQAVQVTQTWMHSSHTVNAFCGPNSLCLLSKDWLGKRPLSAGTPKPSQKVNSS